MTARIRPFWLALAFCIVGAQSLQAQAAEAKATADLHQLFDEYWEAQLREFPTYATFLGDRRYNAQLEDLTAEAVRRRHTYRTDMIRRLEAVAPAALDQQDRLSRSILLYRLRSETRGDRLLGDLPLEFGVFQWPTPVTPMYGPQLWLPQVVKATAFEKPRDYEDYLRRLTAIPTYVSQLTVALQAGMASGWTPPRITLRNVPGQFAALADPNPSGNPMFMPFEAFPAELPEAERARLKQAGETAIRESVAPAFAKLKSFLENRYLPAAREEVAASKLPGGPEYYAATLQLNNTTSLSAQQIHEIGMREVARIEAEMKSVQQRVGFTGTREQFVKYLWSDPKFFFDTPEAMLAACRDIAKRVDPQLPTLFRELPRLPYGVRAMPKEEGDNAHHYIDGAVDGARAGYFEVNTNNLHRSARWQMVDLVLHEAVPGHHLQSARAQEIGELPAFRRYIWFPAYGEGWALYSETLGDLIGMYDDPLDKYGQLSADALRAVRLVVDTGIHALGWSRDKAIQYMKDHAAESEQFIVAEVDRYIVWPGQATAYKIGQLHIAALRDRAKVALRDRFDLRAFHNAVIDGGTMPFEVLDEEIDRWIAGMDARK